jgi:hypothetical protein
MATANLNDMATLAADPTFGNRVFAALMIYCSNTVMNEAVSAATLAQHNARKSYAAQILNNPTFYKPLFVNVVASNQIVANDATASGTIVGETGTTLTTSALLCTDTDIENAVAAAFNAFINGI